MNTPNQLTVAVLKTAGAALAAVACRPPSLIAADPNGPSLVQPVTLAYCEADDCVYADCFTGYDRKSRNGQEAVYSFERNAWMNLSTKVEKRVIKPGQPWRTNNCGFYGNSAWEKVVYSSRYNLLLNFKEGGGMWVMRPEFEKLNWDESTPGTGSMNKGEGRR